MWGLHSSIGRNKDLGGVVFRPKRGPMEWRNVGKDGREEGTGRGQGTLVTVVKVDLILIVRVVQLWKCESQLECSDLRGQPGRRPEAGWSCALAWDLGYAEHQGEKWRKNGRGE